MHLEAEPTDKKAVSMVMGQLATQARCAMGAYLEARAAILHCSIKLIVDDVKVGTWARSIPPDDRDARLGPENAHLISKNSVWAALLGKSDGKFAWRAFSCFACNDLDAAGDRFQCDRENWRHFYRSTLVFPIRYPTMPSGLEYATVGFVAFDSRRPGTFRGLPNIYDFQDDPAGFREKLEDCGAFHLGSIIVDTLGMFLRDQVVC